MRVSADKSDPGYIPGHCALNVEVFFEGIKQSDVITADDKQGYIVQYVIDEKHGLPKLEWIDEGDSRFPQLCLAKVMRHGRVQIIINGER